MPAVKSHAKTEDIIRMRLEGVHASVIASRLGISRTTVYARLSKYDIKALKNNPDEEIKMCEACGIRPVANGFRKLCKVCHRDGGETYFETVHGICH